MASPHSLVPHGCALRLLIARMRSVFQPGEIGRKLTKLPEREHDSLRSTYTRMLERGPERFQLKPAGASDMSALYGLLEHDAAHAFVDEFAEVAIDASQVTGSARPTTSAPFPTPSSTA